MEPIEITDIESYHIAQWRGDSEECINQLRNWWVRKFGEPFFWGKTTYRTKRSRCIRNNNGYYIVNEIKGFVRIITVFSPETPPPIPKEHETD